MSRPDRLGHVRARIGDAIDWARRAEWVRAWEYGSSEAMCRAEAAASLNEAETDLANLAGDDVDELGKVIGELRGILT